MTSFAPLWRSCGRPGASDVERVLARRHLLDFVGIVFPEYRVNWHHRLLAKKLEELQAGTLTRLIVDMPPRHGKSELVSRQFPAWCLGRNPNEQIISCSYNTPTAKDFNRDVQKIMLSPEYKTIFPASMLNERNVVTIADRTVLRNSDTFEIVGARGAYRAAGIGGGITGKGATIGIVDDPIKNHQEAYSPTYRERTWAWWTSTFLTRGEGAFSMGGDVRLAVCVTRWHDDDLVGRLCEKMEEGGEKWEVIELPAILDTKPAAGDPRKQGQALWPAKYSIEHLERIRQAIGERDWNALYQQRPSDISGGTFHRDWWRFYTETPKLDLVWTTWDMSFKDTKTGSFVVGQVLGRRGSDIFLLDQVRGRWDFVETIRRFRAVARKWPQAMAHLVEEKANGAAVISALKGEVMGLIPINPKESKEARAAAIAPLVEAGNIHLPKWAAWLPGLLSELSSFPKGRHDDQVDALTQGVQYGRVSGIQAYEVLTRF